MVIYETIWNFLMVYVFGNVNSTCFEDIYSGILTFSSGTDGRLIWTPSFAISDYGNVVICHLLTIVACISLCVMLWKLLTLPIKWALNSVK